MAVAAGARAATNVITYHNDNLRTGWNQAETVLTPASVATGGFALQAQAILDGQVDAQPLFLSAQSIPGQGTHDVVYVATENDTVYALDAASGAVLASNGLGTPVPQAALPNGCDNVSDRVGIHSTPVIDLPAGLIYVMAYTYENSTAIYRLHALNLATLADAMPPLVVSAIATLSDGSQVAFNARNQRQRAALLESHGIIYAGFAGWCDLNVRVARGWVLGWQATTLTALPAARLVNRLRSVPSSYFQTSVWMSGFGIATDDATGLYFATGNSSPNGLGYNVPNNLSESVVNVSADLTTVQGYFTPQNVALLERRDLDLGSGGVMLLPDQPGGVPHLAIAAGKNQGNTLFLLNRDNLAGGSAILGTYKNNGCWCGPTYYTAPDGTGRVVTSTGRALALWQVQTATGPTSSLPALSLVANGKAMTTGQDPGFFTSVSSNGTQAGSAIVWAISRPANNDPTNTLYLNAYDPGSGLSHVYHAAAGNWPYAARANANLVPVVANGRVYVASYAQLSIFGLGGNGQRVTLAYPAAPPAVVAAGVNVYGVVDGVRDGGFVLRRRDGRLLQVDTRRATTIDLSVGEPAHVRGAYGKGGLLVADVVLHTKDAPLLWPVDK
jgi:hypothetical protein